MSLQGEQVRLLVCLSEIKHNSGVITPSENVIGQRSPIQKGKVEGTNSVSQAKYANDGEQNNQKGEARGKIDLQQDVSTGQFLQRFKNSHFFARIVESNETLWSERSAEEAYIKLMETSIDNLAGDSSENAQILKNNKSVVIDRGGLHSPTSGGVARGAAKCCSLSNGDLVVCFPEHKKVYSSFSSIFYFVALEDYESR